MLAAGIVGFGAAATLILGAAASFWIRLSPRSLGLIMAFGAGVLMSAVAYELVAQALDDHQWLPVYTLSMAAGALVFFGGSVALDRRAGSGGAGGDGEADAPSGDASARGEGAAIVLGSVLDGIPESVVLGVTMIGGAGVSLPMLLAVLISNVPEGLAASAELSAGGVPRERILGMWLLVALVSGLAAAVGFAVFSQAPATWTSGVEMFAGGAILAMLAESMVPEAYEKGGRSVGLATALGFAMSAFLSLT